VKNSAKIFTAVFSRGERVYEKCDFRPIYRFISETIKDMAIDTMKDK